VSRGSVEPRHLSVRARAIPEFAIERIGRLAAQHRAIDLARGAPELTAPEEVKEAAVAAIRADDNQYADTRGSRMLREAIATRTERCLGLTVDADTEVVVTCGATEAIMAVAMATLDPGDEVVLFEPFYGHHVVTAHLSGAVPRFVALRRPDWRFDPEELAAAFNSRTKAVLLNTPHNPTGRVFDESELRLIADLCERWDALCISDEIYEHLVFDGLRHVSPAQMPGMRERTIVISGLSKTYTVTGWRVGYVVGPAVLVRAIGGVHNYLTSGAPAPLQAAGVVALGLPDRYYDDLRRRYQRLRDRVADALEALDFGVLRPQGTFYLLADVGGLPFESDVDCASSLITQAGVALMPGSAFFETPDRGSSLVRICFGKAEANVDSALQRIAQLLGSGSAQRRRRTDG
jgi:aminotransferase